MHGIMAGGSSGETAIPEDSANSLLYLLTARLEEPHMPPRGDKIEKAQLNAIKLWIDQGLLPTASGKPMKKKQSSANLSLNLASMGRPDTPPPLPDHLRLEPYVLTDRAFAPSAMASALGLPFSQSQVQSKSFCIMRTISILWAFFPIRKDSLNHSLLAAMARWFWQVEAKEAKAEPWQLGVFKRESVSLLWEMNRTRF